MRSLLSNKNSFHTTHSLAYSSAGGKWGNIPGKWGPSPSPLQLPSGIFSDGRIFSSLLQLSPSIRKECHSSESHLNQVSLQTGSRRAVPDFLTRKGHTSASPNTHSLLVPLTRKCTLNTKPLLIFLFLFF